MHWDVISQSKKQVSLPDGVSYYLAIIFALSNKFDFFVADISVEIYATNRLM